MLKRALLLPALLAGLAPAAAADLPGGPRLTVREDARALCPPVGASATATLPSLEAMRAAIGERYVNAVAASQDEGTIASRSPRLVWAVQARGACGIALGYLDTGEVNTDRLRACECTHARMAAFKP